MTAPGRKDPRNTPSPCKAGALSCVIVAICALALPAQAQQPVPVPAPTQPGAAPGAARPALKVASAPKVVNGKAAPVVTSPLWRELTPAQQQSLVPLAAKWDTLSEAQKRKWIALSQNFPRMSGAEQAKLHSRMTEWVALSPQQRAQARLNFGEARKIPADDKKAKWEAYQALPPEEKKKLAAGASKPPSTAAAVKPVAPEKLANIPAASRSRPKPDAKTPRIAAAPHQVDHNTLLPQPQPVPAPPPPVTN